MVRHAEGDEYLLKYLSNIANDYKCAVGLALGQISLQRYNIIHFAKTPPFQSEQDKNEEKPLKNLKSIAEVNDSWVADHARQTTRMLPGGMQVLGIFVVSDEDILNPFNSKIKSILNLINKTLLAQNYLYGTGDNEKLVLHFSPKSQRYLAKTYDVVTTNVQPADFKFLQKNNKLFNLQCTYQIDHVYYLKHDEANGPLKKHIKVILDDINRNLESGIIVFDNELKDPDEKLENLNKKKKVPRGSSNKTVQDPNETTKAITVSIFEKCVASKSSDELRYSNIGGQIRIIGEVVCKLWLHSKGTFGEAVQAVKEDIMRSLTTRMEMHWDSLTEEELGEDITSVHEPPRRVLIALPENNVTVSDYLFPGEGPEDAKASLEELLDIKADNHLVFLDLEGQADITQYYRDTTQAKTDDSEDFLPTLRSDSNKLLYILGLGFAIFVLVISIIVHFYTKA
ncbi:unnamed protein product [Ceutorhynchus assimilis]|uniref:Protein odr-4 homolog n=1 Tax=Ceutorhynchus assimilis TaxID=467358 RepID=A0A9N9MRZ4_9CUCU|nr:unnamed protein product [Ceutorhynchus assimilis]